MLLAKRTGHWFRLKRQERGLYSLALSLDVSLKSFDLLRALVSILKKLKEMGDKLYRQIARGTVLAWRFSQAAVEWGNADAQGWRNDRRYILFLGLMFSGQP